MNLSTEEPETPSKPSALAQVVNLFVAPGQALDYARERPGMWWLPLGIVLALQAVMGVWVALTMNMAAWRQMMVETISRANPDHAQQAIHMVTQHGRGYLLFGMLIGLVGMVIIELLYALYLFLADKLFSASNQGYGQWFSFTTWTWLPVSLGLIASIIAWALSDKSTHLMQMDVTNLNTLLFHLKPGSHLFRIAQFSVLQFWVIGLVAYGLKRWRGHGTAKALAIALAPYVAIYAIMYFV